MKLVAALLLIVACEKSGPVETTPGVTETGTGNAPVGPTPVLADPRAQIADAAVATGPMDAATIARVEAAPTRDPDTDEDGKAQVVALQGDSSIGDMSNRRPGADLAKQIDDARGSTSPAATGTVDTGPSERVTVGKTASSDQTSLTVDVAMRKLLPVYLPGIKRCYKTYLKKDPAARGKVGLSLTVSKAGRTESPKATGFVKEIDDCIVGLMTSWRFPIPKTKTGEPTQASFTFELHLVPD